MTVFPQWADTDLLRHQFLIRLAAVHYHAGGSLYKLAQAMGRNRSFFWHLFHDKKLLSAEDAVKVEELTDNAVSRAMLRPDLFSAGVAGLSKDARPEG